MTEQDLPPCIVFEDDHLLVANKPAGQNTHAPSPYAGEGIYDWLRNRERRWSKLAIVQRLDKETSGVLLFSKTSVANRSLTEQFTQHRVRKRYVLWTDRAVPDQPLTVNSSLVRSGEKYRCGAAGGEGERATTRFERMAAGKISIVRAEPLTGKTHQIRVQAAESGFPILGDVLYGGTRAERVYLHAEEMVLEHPATGKEIVFRVPARFEIDRTVALREAIIHEKETNAFRVIHGAADGCPGWKVDVLGRVLLSQSEQSHPDPEQERKLERLQGRWKTAAIYHKRLIREVRQVSQDQAAARQISGAAIGPEMEVLENGMRFLARLDAGYSCGLFLDQRDNRRRLLTGYLGPGFEMTRDGGTLEVLNAFAYTCAFSVCAAMAGARVTSIDLSKNYLEWGRRNFAVNGLEAGGHDFIYGDVFDWLHRLGKRGRTYDAVILDPPTFSQSKASGVFRVEKDYGKLIGLALGLVKRGGMLLASANTIRLEPERFCEMVERAIRESGRGVEQMRYFPQPPDFPIHRDELAHLKSVWVRVG